MPIGASSANAEHQRSTGSVSVIIPTKNRADDLALTIRSLLRQTLLPDEVVIVDQSPDELSKKAVENEFAAAALRPMPPVQLRYLIDPHISGAADARNRAMDMAIGEVWVFLDDDVRLEENFLEELLAAYARHPEIAGVSGMITNYVPHPLIPRLWSWVFVRGPFRDDRQPIYLKAERLRTADVIPVSRFTGAAMSFRARSLQNLRFDPRLTGGSLAEDVDLCMRLRPARLVLAPRARVAHERSAAGRPHEHWLRAHAQSANYLYARHLRHDFGARLALAWMSVGYGLALTAACARRRSLEPWRSFMNGVHRARAITASGGPTASGGSRRPV
jgi:GT2 family glycosyltransferase